MPKSKEMPVRIVSRRSKVPAPVSGGAVGSRAPVAFGLPAPPAGYVQKPAGISLCMIVKNEERFLAQCLESIKDFVDEICIVDTGSTDRTIEIARSYGARIEEHPWRNDFGWARDRALAMATKRWIFQLDADEELLPESHEALRTLRNALAYRVGVWVRCNNAADDYAGTGSMSHALVRIFPNDPQIKYRGAIHEFATIGDNPVGISAVQAPISILHHGYLKEIVKERKKGERNLDIIRRQVEAEPGDPFHRFNLGMTAFLVRDNEAARDGFEMMRTLIGSETRGFVPNGLATLADVYTERLGQPEKAIPVAIECLKHSPHYANAHFALGKAYLALKRYGEGRGALLAAIDDGKYLHLQFVVDDEVPVWKAQSEIGSSYVSEGDDNQALEWFERGIANRPKAQPIRLNRARALERLNRLDEAGETLRGVFDDFGDEQSTLHYVNFLLRQKRDREAVDIVEQSYLRLPRRAAVSLLVGATAVAQRNGWTNPQRYLELAAAAHPGAAEALNPLEAHYRESGNDAALDRLVMAETEAEPVESEDFLRRSYRGIALGTFDEGLGFALRGLEKAPHDPMLRYNAAICSVNQEMREEALVHLDTIDRSNLPVYGKAAFLRGVVLRDLGRTADALAASGDALEANPGQIDAILLRAGLYEVLGKTGDAEATLVAAMDSGDQRVAVELASLYLRAGRVDEARAIADKALA